MWNISVVLITAFFWRDSIENVSEKERKMWKESATQDSTEQNYANQSPETLLRLYTSHAWMCSLIFLLSQVHRGNSAVAQENFFAISVRKEQNDMPVLSFFCCDVHNVRQIVM